MKNIVYAFISMTVSGSVIFLLFKLTELITRHFFSASWHYRILKCVVLFFYIPFGTLYALLLKNAFIKLLGSSPSANGANYNNGTITAIMNALKGFGINYSQLSSYLISIWIVGIIVLFVWQIICYIKFHHTISVYRNQANPHIIELANLCAKQQGISKPINLYVNEFIDTPMLIGFLTPSILLPTDQLDPQSAKYVLTHELIHYKNRDLFVKFAMLIIRIIHWFNPLIYLLLKDLDKWCEYSCDEKNVLNLPADLRKQYGRVILDAISVMPTYGTSFSTPFLMPKQKLKERLAFMINAKRMSMKARVLSYILMLSLMTFGVATAYAAETANNNLDTVITEVNEQIIISEVASTISQDLSSSEPERQERLKVYTDLINP